MPKGTADYSVRFNIPCTSICFFLCRLIMVQELSLGAGSCASDLIPAVPDLAKLRNSPIILDTGYILLDEYSVQVSHLLASPYREGG